MHYFIKGKDPFATIGKKVRHIHEALEHIVKQLDLPQVLGRFR